MSVKISCIRSLSAQQWEAADSSGVSGEIFYTEGRCLTYREYDFIEIVTYGWASGARSRVKRLTLTRALAYVNKLYFGGWIDDDTYNAMYRAVEHVVAEISRKRRQLAATAPWEVFPYDFS